ncbi:hypothetical protein QFC22_002561 [Naganishia vaughanmartiniae]|uniref:Uncharacterized protein n=1 Tax=Naganishia vaughanmartiniae TaxID=1424756 RepID=A0ACC2XD25_9TREE|nr:hypothetical protein QFC22_002561 [Naganishia vaughanmartiniae]
MDQVTLPAGWTAQWDEREARYLYVDTTTNTATWDLPPTTPSSGSATAAAAAAPATTGAHGHKRRQYPTAQLAGYDTTSATPPAVSSAGYAQQGGMGMGGQGMNMAQAQQGGMGVPAAAGGGQMFTPGLSGQQPAAAGTGGYFAPAGQVPGVPSGAPAAGGYGQQDVPQQQGYAGQPMVPGMQGLTDGFRGMGMGEKLHPLQTVNLIGLQPDVREIDTAPPPILLPPGACISPHPTAQADPSYQRSTINAIPTTASLLNKSKIPLALILTPYRSLKPGDEPVPVVNDTVIARCRRCRSYINPYVTFIEGGARWKCCMCNLSNEVPQLFDWNAQTNQPADRWSRAELNHGVVEFVAPAEYMIRAPQPPVYVFIIDVSQNAIQSGMVATAARTILESLDRLPNADDRTKIGFIAVSSSLHFFSLPPGQAEPTMLVVSDVDDVYLPKPTDLLVNLTESRPVIESFLTRLSDMFKDSFTSASAVGPAMQAAHKLIGTIGGKIITLTATLPTVGEGALKARDDAKLLGTAKEATLLQAASSFYKTFSIDCARNQVTVDMFLFSPQYTDVASLRCLPRYTGGQVYYYPGFNAGRSEDAIKFATEFGTVLASPIGLEAVIRVRGSRGLRMSAFHGNFFTRSTDLLSLPTVPIDQSYAIELQIEDPLTQPVVVLQTAVLHTTCYGERRIRVMTTALPTTTSMSEIFASADQNAILTLLANKAVERAMSSKLEDARDAVVNKLVDILKVYKDTMTSAGGGASAQLAIPDNLKLLPLLCCGLVKHVGLRESTQIPPDLRAYAHALLTTLPTQSLLAYIHPRFYSLHNMPADAGTIGPDGVILPPALNLTSERLERHGLYLIDDGQNIFLYVGQDAVPQLIMDVFGLPSYQELKGGKYTLPVLDNPFSQRVNAIIGKTREMRRNPYWQHLYVVKADAEPALRNWALSMLIEDRVDRSASYGQFLSLIKDKILLWRTSTRLEARYASTVQDRTPGNIYRRSFSLQAVDDQDDGPGTLLNIDYSEWYFSSSKAHRPFVFTALVMWAGFLFSTIGITASDFFCPNLATVADRLGLGESTAGVTFLAFGNGSPDVFSTFSALKSNTFALAIGELLGASAFITSIVVGSMALIQPFQVPRWPFLRDVGFFTVAVMILVACLKDGKLTLPETGGLVGMYVCYVGIVVGGNWWHGRRKARREQVDGMGRIKGIVLPGAEGETEDYFSAPVGNANAPNSLLKPDDALLPLGTRRASIASNDSRYSDHRAAPESLTLSRQTSSETVNQHLSSHPEHRRPRIDAPRPTFSLLGAIEFRDAVNALRKESAAAAAAEHGRHLVDDGQLSGQLDDLLGEPNLMADYFGPTTPFPSGHYHSFAHGHGHHHARYAAGSGRSPSKLGAGSRHPSVSRIRKPYEDDATSAAVTPSLLENSYSSIGPPRRDSVSRVESTPLFSAGQQSVRKARSITDLRRSSAGAIQGVHTAETKKRTEMGQVDHGHTEDHSMTLHVDQTPLPADPTTASIPDVEDGSIPLLTTDDGRVRRKPLQAEDSSARPWFRAIRHVAHVLFPALQGFRQKSVSGKVLGIFATPAILALTVTLPVVDDAAEGISLNQGGIKLEDGDTALPEDLDAGNGVYGQQNEAEHGGIVHHTNDAEAEDDQQVAAHAGTDLHRRLLAPGGAGEWSPVSPLPYSPSRGIGKYVDEVLVGEDGCSEGSEEQVLLFNKYLTALQAVLGTLFCSCVIFSENAVGKYVIPSATVAGTLVGITALVVAKDGTDPTWRLVRCFAGFFSAMLWIAAIADEVVEILQTFGKILGLSNAIIGLTGSVAL